MKRRKRKRNSNAASPSEIPIDAEKAGLSAGLSEADREFHPGEEVTSAVEVKKPDSDPTAIAGADHVIDLGEELIAHVEEEKPASDPAAPAKSDDPSPSGDQFSAPVQEKKSVSSVVAPAGADRRIHPRYEFVAAVELMAADSGARMASRVRDLSQEGCYVDTSNALPLGTLTEVRIEKGAELFEAHARVVYSRAGKGMGLVFTAIEPERRGVLETWLAESRETSWLAANRRRSQRVLMTIPVRVSGRIGTGSPFEEDTLTRAISAHGALILVSAQVYRGQRLTLSNVQTKAALECVVAHISRQKSDPPQVGVEFMLPNPMFWHVAFPPKDWTPRHPHAKSGAKKHESS